MTHVSAVVPTGAAPITTPLTAGSARHVPGRSEDTPERRHATAKRAILWIDDEVTDDDPLIYLLGAHGFNVDVARSASAGQARAQANAYDAIILDLHLPGMFGLTLLQRLRATGVSTPVLVATAHYLEAEMQANAMRSGATAFMHKPFLDPQQLVTILDSIIGAWPPLSLDDDAAVSAFDSPFGIVTVSPAMRRVVDAIERLGPIDAPILLTGETGTGKELVARALHQASLRAKGPFVALNCAALPENLVQSELFGHRKGAFTGAVTDKEGMFEAAHNGTLFLDEIGDLPLSMQANLLRCLDSGEVRRVGETRTRKVNVRVVAATNRTLRRDIKEGRFRADLYYRIAMLHAELPPLRDRLDDVDALIAYWLPAAADRWHKPVTGITRGALDILRSYSWPGNVRELFNVLHRSVAIARGELLSESDVSESLYERADASAAGPAAERLPDDLRRILAALDEHHGNHTKAARGLGINRSTLWRRLAQYGLGKRRDSSSTF